MERAGQVSPRKNLLRALVFLGALVSSDAGSRIAVAQSAPPRLAYGALVAEAARAEAADQPQSGDEATAAAESARIVEDFLSTSSKILRGRIVARREFPWMVALGSFKSGRLEQHCGGTIVGARWVLTAAHCPAAKGHSVVARITDLHEVTEPSALVEDRIEGPYNRQTRDSDYALLRLDRDLGIAPICLNRDPAIESRKNLTLTIAGWGQTMLQGRSSEVLLKAEVMIDDQQECAASYGFAGLPLSGTMFCAAAERRDACYGDSGGPAVYKVGRSWQQVGIISWGKDCGQFNYPGVYTRASAIASWVSHHTKACDSAASAPPAPATAGSVPK